VLRSAYSGRQALEGLENLAIDFANYGARRSAGALLVLFVAYVVEWLVLWTTGWRPKNLAHVLLTYPMTWVFVVGVVVNGVNFLLLRRFRLKRTPKL
jgi:hypothetical protein